MVIKILPDFFYFFKKAIILLFFRVMCRGIALILSFKLIELFYCCDDCDFVLFKEIYKIIMLNIILGRTMAEGKYPELKNKITNRQTKHLTFL